MECKKPGAAALPWLFRCSFTPACHTLQLPLDPTNLGAFERQIVHQALLIEDEPDYRTADAVGVDLPACPNCDDGDRSVDADLPAVGALEVCKCGLSHEHDDRGSRLRTELKPDRGRKDVVVAGGAATNVQRAFAIFTTDSEACLDDCREDQDCHRLVGKLTTRPDLPEEVFERCAYAGVDLRGRCGMGPWAQAECCKERHHGYRCSTDFAAH